MSLQCNLHGLLLNTHALRKLASLNGHAHKHVKQHPGSHPSHPDRIANQLAARAGGRKDHQLANTQEQGLIAWPDPAVLAPRCKQTVASGMTPCTNAPYPNYSLGQVRLENACCRALNNNTNQVVGVSSSYMGVMCRNSLTLSRPDQVRIVFHEGNFRGWSRHPGIGELSPF